MKKFALSVAATLIASATLVACNSGSTNASDISSPGAASVAKSVCTSSNNWQSVGVGMSATQVQDRLGKPIRIETNATLTTYHYESCRGFFKKTADAVPAVPAKSTTDATTGVVTITPGTPYKPTQYTTVLKPGIVTLSGDRGVVTVSSPEPETEFNCELDFFNYPNVSIFERDENGEAIRFNCRASNNPY